MKEAIKKQRQEAIKAVLLLANDSPSLREEVLSMSPTEIIEERDHWQQKQDDAKKDRKGAPADAWEYLDMIIRLYGWKVGVYDMALKTVTMLEKAFGQGDPN